MFGALVGAGLSVTYLGEHPDDYWDAFQEAMKDGAHGAPKTGGKPETADEAKSPKGKRAQSLNVIPA